MDELASRILEARIDPRAMDALLSDYQPFLRREANKTVVTGLAEDDKLSVAMLVFVQCARQYQPERGGFMAYAATCIRNRLLDEGRKSRRQIIHAVSLEGDEASHETTHAALSAYDRQMERQALIDEIDALGAELSRHGITLSGLEEICPRQKRSRELCVWLARAVVSDAALSAAFRQSGRLPQAELSKRAGVSPKTIEKHRRYIVTIAVILSGDYSSIRAFLPPKGGMA
ncbi:sigma-70 family RNA polymerase sigma factor [Eubacteriales bacterium OttesenSCG-928-A19]|nr:sigma-70 family RNA polymerase sigma factor [Eubacteriales bacterium OttesenSCG-928-A19]